MRGDFLTLKKKENIVNLVQNGGKDNRERV